MRWSTVSTVVRKELRETIRDRRTVLMMLVIPIALYPLLFVLMEQMAMVGQRNLEERPAAVAVVGDPELARVLDRDSMLTVERVASVPPGALGSGRYEAAVVVASVDGQTRSARILYDASRERSGRTRQRVERRLDEWSDTLVAQRVAAAGLPAGFERPLALSDSSVAAPEKVGGSTLGRFLPMFLILMTLLGVFYPAIDMAAGEKERGTLETLLTAPVPPGEIVAGKFIAVSCIGFTAAALNFGSMLLTFQSGVFRLAAAAGVSFTIPLRAIVVVLLILVPLSVLLGALSLGLAVRARSFKEGQNALMPLNLFCMPLAMLVTIPGIEFTPAVAAVPITGVAFLFRAMITGEAPGLPTAIALATTGAAALAALAFAAAGFGREEVLFGGSSTAVPVRERVQRWRSGPKRLPLAIESLAFIAGIALLYFYLGRILQGSYGEQGLLWSEVFLLAVPAIVFAVGGPFDWRETLALRPAPITAYAAALLLLAGGLPVAWMIGWLQHFVLPVPEDLLRAMERMLSAADSRRLLWLLFLAAVVPAVCEELVFRGVLLQGLRRELPVWRAVGTSALIFGAFHLSNETVARFLPTAWLGVLVGYVAFHTRSLLPGVLMHFANNATVVVILSVPWLRAMVPTEGPPPWPVLAAAPLLLWGGARLLRRSVGGPPGASASGDGPVGVTPSD